MSNPNRVAGIVFVKVDGAQLKIKANVNCNRGDEKREGIVGHDGVHGYKSLPQIPYIEGEQTDSKDLDLKKYMAIDGATVTVQFANGKTFVLRQAWNASEGTVGSEEANISFRFEGLDAEWINP
jgi:hypothetical protein